MQSVNQHHADFGDKLENSIFNNDIVFLRDASVSHMMEK